MTDRLTGIILLTLILFTFSGCNLIEDIFAAGMWVGVILVLVVVIIVVAVIRAFRT